MSAFFLTVVTLLYSFVALGFFLNGKPGMGLCFVGYCIANVGIIWETTG